MSGASTRIGAFAARVEREHGVPGDDYEALWRWSTTDLEAFWTSIADAFDVRFHSPPERVLGEDRMPGARWFPGATLNWAEHVLRAGAPDDVAVVASGEAGDVRELTRADLRSLTARVATGLRQLGVSRGDHVVGYVSNTPEAVAALLACASIGAVWSSCSPDFGTGAVLDRFAQLDPVALLAVDGYRYGGREFDRREVVVQLRDALPTLRHVVVLDDLAPATAPADVVTWEALIAQEEPLRFAELPFDHPLWVLWTSGTTGLPKGLVHGHGGILLEQLKAQGLHLDAGPADRVLWFTTTGWMMWNYLVGCLLHGSAIVLVDGSPGWPDLDRLWDVAERAGVTVFGTSASYVGACMKADARPRAGRRLDALRAVGSTGSPLSPEAFDWLQAQLGPIWIASISGGSDLCTAFLGGHPGLPVVRGELQCRALGAAVEAWTPAGRPVVGEVGELVLTRPMPSMPLRLVGDEDGSRHRDAYFATWPGVWRHGDWLELTERGSAVIHGRSDSTINRGGIRMGTAELYAAVLELDEVIDVLAVDVREPGGDGWLPLFAVLADGVVPDAVLRRRLAARIRERCSPRHVPDEVHAVPAIPRTLSGKVLEIPVKRLLEGADPAAVASRDALQDPEALDWFAAFAARRRTP